MYEKTFHPVIAVVTVALLAANGIAYGQASAQGNAAVSGDVSASRDSAEANASGSGSASAEAAGYSAGIGSGSEIAADLAKSVDAGRAKAGDEVTATVTQDVRSAGQVVIPRGSKLVGRVTEASARGSGEGASKLGLVFDRVVLRDGREIPVATTLQAVSAARAAADAGMSQGAPMPRAGGGVSGGGLLGGAAGAAVGSVGSVSGTVGSAVSGAARVTGSSTGAVGGLNAAGMLESGSRGVFGLRGLELASGVAGSSQGSVIHSGTRNVRLDTGTQLLLSTTASATR